MQPVARATLTHPQQSAGTAHATALGGRDAPKAVPPRSDLSESGATARRPAHAPVTGGVGASSPLFVAGAFSDPRAQAQLEVSLETRTFARKMKQLDSVRGLAIAGMNDALVALARHPKLSGAIAAHFTRTHIANALHENPRADTLRLLRGTVVTRTGAERVAAVIDTSLREIAALLAETRVVPALLGTAVAQICELVTELSPLAAAMSDAQVTRLRTVMEALVASHKTAEVRAHQTETFAALAEAAVALERERPHVFSADFLITGLAPHAEYAGIVAQTAVALGRALPQVT